MRKRNPLKHFGIAKDMPQEVLDDFKKAVLDAKNYEKFNPSKNIHDA